MKRFIPFAFATLAIPFLSMAQTSAPPPEEEKPLVPKAPVPAPETVVPAPSPAVPAEVPPGKPPAAVPSDSVPTAVPPVPGLPEKPATPGSDRPDRPGAKRRGPPGAKDPTGAPENPVPAPPGTAPESSPSSKPVGAAPVPSADKPSERPAETPDTPPANRGKGKGKGPANRGKGPATSDTPPTSPENPGTPPPAPGSAEARPMPGKRPADPQERGRDPSAPPAPTPGAPMPAVTATPAAPGEPKPAERPEGRERPERPAAQKPPSQETANVLQDEPKRDRQADAAQARKIDNKDDAKRLLLNILGAGAAAVGVDANDRRGPNDRRDPDPRHRRDGFRPGYRPSFEEVGRTQQDRERAVSTIVERFQGRAPQAAPSGSRYREQRVFQTTETQGRARFYDGNRRVIRYSSMQEIPPIIVASQQLQRVQVLPQAQSTYSVRPQAPQPGRYQNDIPPSYTSGNAYAVSYSVDPESAISTDAILFRQGSTDFADAYSYDLVIDMADAMKAPALGNSTFVIEGHASAEGDYGQNLQLSQERAERISRELVRHGVSAERLMPVGYGEAEAATPADGNEADRRLDRRVVVFRMR